MSEQQVVRTLYLKNNQDIEQFKKHLSIIEGDFYFKGKDTGDWIMLTNKDDAISDELFVVTVISYDNDKSIKYANDFSNYLVSWFKFTELKNKWESIK